ncbi:hypothetical protein BDP27DRAFT_16591 [Rhodocollybia butyracea]|uniref:SNF5-domain-containing protein n=1 Tax=Rhodocollybia butyracea TaxID=206335 RepID=A0A9P5UH45_9AGAR|nr:hypothetical protein BDP27DRAFT_16591 [Rhodocollybia butyracea]
MVLFFRYLLLFVVDPNLIDPVVTPEIFAQSIVEDYQLAPSYHSTIVRNIQEQLADYKAHSALYDGEGGEYLGDDNDPSLIEKGILHAGEAMWWESWRKRLRTEFGFVRTGKDSLKSTHKRKVKQELDADVENITEPPSLLEEKSMALNEFEVDEDKMAEDMRIVIKLDIIVGSMKLDDQFEWDIDNVKASPEHFAEVYTQDLGLSGEFRTAIAHSIREQIQTYQKSLFLVGRPSDGSTIQDEELRSAFLPSLVEGARAMDQVQSFTPLLNYLSDGEIEKERDKDITRRRKRNTRGRRGVNLPDREPIKTYRTPALGFPELDAATLALAAAANAPVSRRAAAAAASLTIANMVASENGTPLTPLTLPAAPQPAAVAAIAREKKVKGLFKAPPVPPSVIRPRAKVAAPTPSTAADVSSLPAPLENDPLPSISTPDNRARSRRNKDLELREAKEKEFADGQHANYIDGVWHCSNCGCPESIAVGRRKGPLGDKSQCGECGIYWHRHRRPRPCTYNTDPDYHTDAKPEKTLKSGSKRKGAAAALRAQGSTVSTPAADDSSAPPTPARDRKKDGSEAPSRQSPPPSRLEEDRTMSPISSASSASEPPLSQRLKKTNGSTPAPRRSNSPSQDSKLADVQESKNSKDSELKDLPRSTPPRSTVQSPPGSPTKTWPPHWLTNAMQSTQGKYPNDKFEVVLRKVGEGGSPEWRIKCVDCPGKLYKPGPEETLSNFEVHLNRNKQHRQRVDDRIGK